MIKFLKELINDNYVYCPWNKYIPKFIIKKLGLLRVGVWLLNLNKAYILEDDYGYWKLRFLSGSFGNFWLKKNLYTVRKI
jgi:hypothetical protein